MEIFPCVREDELRLEPTAEIGECLFHLGAGVREKSIPEVVHLDNDAVGRGEKCVGARTRLLLARGVCGEDDPRHLELWKCTSERQERPPHPISMSSA